MKKGMGKGLRLVLGLGAVVVVGCGQKHDASDMAEGGAGGAEPIERGGGGGSDETLGGAGAGSDVGGAGAGPTFTRHDGITDLARIAGTSFNVEATDSSYNEAAGGYGPDGAYINELTVHFDLDANGNLELVTSNPEPWLHIDRTPLVLDGDIWKAETPPPTGGRIHPTFEGELEVIWTKPDRWQLQLLDADASGAPTKLEIRAHYPPLLEGGDVPRTLSTSGTRDTAAPHLVTLGGLEYNRTAGIAGPVRPDQPEWNATYLYWPTFSWLMPRAFFFSEALKPGWSVALEDDKGAAVEIAKGAKNGSETGFVLDSYYPKGYRWNVRGEDLAGNAFSANEPLADDELPLVDGEFESDATIATIENDADVADAEIRTLQVCDNFSRGLCVGGSLPGYPKIAALSGQRSLALNGQGYLRIARKPNASTVTFVARFADMALTTLSLGVMSLDPGSAKLVTQDVTGTFTDSDPKGLTAVRRFTLPVPAGTGDVLVAIDVETAGDETPLWLDSLRTQ